MRERDKQPVTYILASERNGTLYIGVSSDLIRRIWQHRNALVDGFSSKYRAHVLVYYELHETMESAILRKSGALRPAGNRRDMP